MGGSAGAEARKTRRTQHPEDRKNPTIERHRHSGKIAASGAVSAETRRRTLKNQTKNDGNSFSIDLLFPKREAQNFGGQRQKQRTRAQRRQEAMDPGGKRVRTDSPSTGSQRDGPRPESLQSAIPNPARIRKWECVSKRRIHRSEICIEPQDGGSFGRKGRMDANPIGKRAAGWLRGNSPKGTSRIENRSCAERAPPKTRDGTLPKKQSRLA